MVSTKWCQAGQVNVYDTAFDKLDSQSRRLIKAMFSLKSADSICMVPVQKQRWGSDCGAFALAMMNSMKTHLKSTTVKRALVRVSWVKK